MYIEKEVRDIIENSKLYAKNTEQIDLLDKTLGEINDNNFKMGSAWVTALVLHSIRVSKFEASDVEEMLIGAGDQDDEMRDYINKAMLTFDTK